MKALILLGTLKTVGLSNTETLSAFFKERLRSHNVECELIKLWTTKFFQAPTLTWVMGTSGP